ncbi:tol protein [Colletotrichum incanum]|nr:tol protein [Colletotrichum incanum]
MGLDSLPTTIRDAVEMCRSIGLCYLWVDALCIAQDDENDKLDQITNMGLIYKHSALTVVAATPVLRLEATTGTVYPIEKEDTQVYWPNEPILQPGWTYQKLLLSPRAIIFDSEQITLKCPTYDYRPVFETYVEVEVTSPTLPVGVFGMVDENLARRDMKQSRDHYIGLIQNHMWEKVVYDYSKRDHGSFDDRLPAVAGIAA